MSPTSPDSNRSNMILKCFDHLQVLIIHLVSSWLFTEKILKFLGFAVRLCRIWRLCSMEILQPRDARRDSAAFGAEHLLMPGPGPES
jgi:hypothetical protein